MNTTLKSLLDRYGPTIGVVTALTLLVILLPNTTRVVATDGTPTGDSLQADQPSPTPSTGAVVGTAPRPTAGGTGASTSTGGPAPHGTAPSVLGHDATGAVWGPGHYPPPGAATACRSDGRMPDFSFYSPVCVPVFRGDNGGSTSMGVSRKDILIVRYAKQVDPATQAALEGAKLADPAQVSARQREVFARYFSLHYETYGRRIKVVDFKGTGSSTDETVLRADAVQIAAMKPFAVFDPVGSAALIPFAQELAARKIVCLCVNFTGRGFFQKAAPYDLSDLGFDAVRIETPEGKQEYAAAQRRFSERAAPLRQRMIEDCHRLLSEFRQ